MRKILVSTLNLQTEILQNGIIVQLLVITLAMLSGDGFSMVDRISILGKEFLGNLGQSRDKNFKLYAQHQRTFNFDFQTFSSEFECGNQAGVDQITNTTYSLYQGGDPKAKRYNNKNWFYFKVTNEKNVSRNVNFSIENMSNNWSMWKNGVTPVFKSKLTDWQWKIMDIKPVYQRLTDRHQQLSFNYKIKKKEIVYFALTYPWTATQDLRYYSELKKTLDQIPSLYIHKMTMARSLEKRNLEVVWQTSASNVNYAKKLPRLKNLFPDKSQSMPYLPKNKCTYFLSARVHPSETASSFVLRYFIEGVLQNWRFYGSKQKSLLDECTLIIIPMLNPDGVVNGLTRHNMAGQNLNAVYRQAYRGKMPTIWAYKELVKWYNKMDLFYGLFDLHSHTTKRGIFFFCNPLTQSTYKSILTIPYQFNMEQKDFDFNKSNFGIENIESSARKEFYRQTRSSRVYTLEINYWGDVVGFESLKRKGLIVNNKRIIKNFDKYYRIEKFKEIGVNLARATILDRRFSKEDWRNNAEMKKMSHSVNENIRKYYKKIKEKSKRKKKLKKQKKEGQGK